MRKLTKTSTFLIVVIAILSLTFLSMVDIQAKNNDSSHKTNITRLLTVDHNNTDDTKRSGESKTLNTWKRNNIQNTPNSVPIPVTPIPTIQKPVSFDLNPGNPKECGVTCRKTTAILTNRGDKTAHNVCVTLEVYNNNGDIIYINGDSSIQKCVGDISGGESVTEDVVINADCGFLFSKCLARPFVLKSRVTYDGGIFEFPDRQFS